MPLILTPRLSCDRCQKTEYSISQIFGQQNMDRPLDVSAISFLKEGWVIRPGWGTMCPTCDKIFLEEGGT